jgi:hypothetical protein
LLQYLNIFAAIHNVENGVTAAGAGMHFKIWISNCDATIFIGSRSRRRQKNLQYEGNKAS